MSEPTYDVDLVALYRRRGLVTQTDPPRAEHLPTRCPQAAACWKSLGPKDKPPEGHPAAALSAPWIGTSYEKGSTVIVMENLRHYGGFDLRPNASSGMRHLGRLAREQLRDGRRRLFANEKYRGTDVWTRGLAYASIWLDADRVLVDEQAVETGPGVTLVAAQDRVAIVQHVKCSPHTGGSEQTPAMWEACGRHVLAGELAILRPLRVIVLGTGDNADAMRRHVFEGVVRQVRREQLAVGRRTAALSLFETDAAWGPVRMLVAPHPAGRGGNDRGLLALARKVLA